MFVCPGERSLHGFSFGTRPDRFYSNLCALPTRRTFCRLRYTVRLARSGRAAGHQDRPTDHLGFYVLTFEICTGRPLRTRCERLSIYRAVYSLPGLSYIFSQMCRGIPMSSHVSSVEYARVSNEMRSRFIPLAPGSGSPTAATEPHLTSVVDTFGK